MDATLGIMKSDKKFAKVYKDGYAYIMNYGKLADRENFGSYGSDYGAICADGDIIEMILDMNKMTLSYKVNDKEYGVAFHNIDNTKYKAGLTMCHKTSKYEFISYMNFP